jgi:hypothetical protein
MVVESSGCWKLTVAVVVASVLPPKEAVPVTVTLPGAVSEIATVHAPVALSVVQDGGVKVAVVSLEPKVTRTPPCGAFPVWELTLAVRVVEPFTGTVLTVTASCSETGVAATYWLKCGSAAVIVWFAVLTVDGIATGVPDGSR